MLQVELVSEFAKLPAYATEGAACFDLSAAIDKAVVVPPCQAVIVPTGLKVEVPPGHVLKLYSRSGHGFKNNVRLANCVGIIDSDYRGEVMASIFNDSVNEFRIQPGDRILQGMIEKAEQVEIVKVNYLSDTKRGIGGFGSTG